MRIIPDCERFFLITRTKGPPIRHGAKNAGPANGTCVMRIFSGRKSLMDKRRAGHVSPPPFHLYSSDGAVFGSIMLRSSG